MIRIAKILIKGLINYGKPKSKTQHLYEDLEEELVKGHVNGITYHKKILGIKPVPSQSDYIYHSWIYFNNSRNIK